MTYELHVEDIKCGGCPTSIKNGLTKISGVNEVKVDIDNGIINVETTENVTRESITEKLHRMGNSEIGKGSILSTATSFVSCMIGRVTS